MKKIILNVLFLSLFISSMIAQNIPQGMSYQAVARAADGQLLAETPISIRITLISNIERKKAAYTEIHNIKTNKYGLFNFTIGQGESLSGTFAEIPWESEEIWLEVAMDENAGENFKEMNTTKLLTVPYAFRAGSANELIPINPNNDSRVPWWGQPWWNIEGLEKTDPDKHFVGNIDSVDLVFRTNNIIRFRIGADGSIYFIGDVDIGGNLYVHGDSTVLDHDLAVGDNVYVENNITVDNDFTVGGESALNGQVTIKANLAGGDSNYDAYPLRVEGSGQGIAIKANTGNPSNSNNFLTFFDSGNSAIGRIEGETLAELTSNDEYIREKGALDVAVTLASIDVATGAIAVVIAAADLVAASTSSTGCAGIGACVTAPIPSLIVAATANQIAVIADEVAIAIGLADAITQRDFFVANKAANIGVTYQSGSADYAEWLPKANPTEKFVPGYVVGMKNGRISLNTEGADKLFAISTKPIVLGNMPEQGKENEYEKVAFMGQVPVHVIGKVDAGDYILPSGNNNGFAKAVSPANMKAADYANIVGMAWSSSTNDSYNLINVAIGLNTGDISKVVAEQNKEIEELKRMNNETNAILAKLIPGFKEAAGMEDIHVVESAPKTDSNLDHEDVHFVTPDESNIVYFEITSQQIQDGIDLAEKIFVENGGDINTHPFWKRMNSDASYNDIVVNKFKTEMQKTIHMHKEVNN